MNTLTQSFKNKAGVLGLFLLTGLVVMLIFWPSLSSAQCAMCKAVVGSNMESGSGPTARGINSAILYLMATPYLLGMIVIYAMFGDKIKAWFKSKTA